MHMKFIPSHTESSSLQNKCTDSYTDSNASHEWTESSVAALRDQYNASNTASSRELLNDCESMFKRLLKLDHARVSAYGRQMVALKVEFARLNDVDSVAKHDYLHKLNTSLRNFLSILNESTSVVLSARGIEMTPSNTSSGVHLPDSFALDDLVKA